MQGPFRSCVPVVLDKAGGKGPRRDGIVLLATQRMPVLGRRARGRPLQEYRKKCARFQAVASWRTLATYNSLLLKQAPRFSVPVQRRQLNP